jgi:hypothetical protein
MPLSDVNIPLWLIGVALLLPVVHAWMIRDALKSGQVKAGKGIWHRTVMRDDDPIEYWMAIAGNCIVGLLWLGGVIALLVMRFQK